MNADFHNSGIFTKDKNIAFATIKEFFVKHLPDKITSERLSDMLSEDVNNMFYIVKNQC